MENPKSEEEDIITHIVTKEELDKALKEAGSKLVTVMFYAKWCAASLMMEPVIESASDENKECVFIKVNSNEAEDLTDELDIYMLPSFFFYKDSDKIDEFLGANEHMFREKLASNLPEQ